jgi:hypothetical protein
MVKFLVLYNDIRRKALNSSMQHFILSSLIKFFIFMIIIVRADIAFAADSTANSTALLTTPITIVKECDLILGTFLPDIAEDGDYEIKHNDAAPKKYDEFIVGKFEHILSSPTYPAQFTVAGTPYRSFSILIPAGITISKNEHKLTITKLTSYPEENSVLDMYGHETIYVYAIIKIQKNQQIGAYNGSFTVTVNYD